MICCTLIALIFGAFIWSIRNFAPGTLASHRNPMHWTLEDQDIATTPPSFSWSNRARSFGYAINGLKSVVRHEHNAWIHLFTASVVVILGFWLRLDATAWRWIIACICLVLFAETVNTALETMCDVISPGQNPAIGLAKDVAAGAVLICAITAFIIGSITFAPFVVGHATGLHGEICSS